MSLANPITPIVKSRIDDELPNNAAKLSVADIFDLAFKQQRAVDDRLAAVNPLSWNEAASNGLTFAFHAGIFHTGRGAIQTVAAGNVVLTANQTNYIELRPSNGVVQVNTTGFQAGSWPMYKVVTDSAGFSADDVTDQRPFATLVHLAGLGLENLADEVADVINFVAFSVGAESGDDIDVTIQVKDAQGNDLSEGRILELFLADALEGWETATAPSGGIAIQTGTDFGTLTANKRIRVKADANGQAIIRITEAGAQTWYMGVILQGLIHYSSAITFT
ncbi:MAG: hypothetical protein MI923_16210 [Phycisphaerales bacterium]|nr:hypothetical protein [Phycisphaerales bacterium]